MLQNHNGTASAAQNGASVIIPGRVSVLTISNHQSDSKCTPAKSGIAAVS